MKYLTPALSCLLIGGICLCCFAQPEPLQAPKPPAEQQPETPTEPESPPEPPQLPGQPEETPEPLTEPATNPLATAAQSVPYSVTLIAELHHPARLLPDLRRHLELIAAADLRLKSAYDEGFNVLKDLLGGDPFHPTQLQSLGLDPARPWRLSVLELTGRMEPSGIVLSAAVSDAQELNLALERVFLKKNVNTKEIAQNDRRIIQTLNADGTPSSVLLVQEGGYLHLFMTAPGTDTLQGYKDFAQELARRPLWRDRRFHPVTVGLTPQADVSGFLNLKSIADKLPLRQTPALLNDFSSAAFQLTNREWNAQALLSKYSGVETYLRPGSRCQELIVQADPPLLALTYSLEQPVQLLQYLAANVDPIRGGALFPPDNAMGTGLTLERLAELLRDGSGGLLLYEGENYQANPFVVLACFQVTDREAGHAWMARLAEQNQKAFYPNLKDAELMPETQLERPAGIQIKHYGPNTVWTVRTTNSGIAYALVGDFVIMGDAVKQIHNLARGEGDGWNPRCGGEELFSAEVRPGELLKALARRQTRQADIAPALAAIDQYFGTNGHLIGSIQYEEGLLKTSVKPALGTFGDTGASFALLSYWAGLAQEWTRKAPPEQYAQPTPNATPTPAKPTTPKPNAAPESEYPQPTRPSKRLTPGGEDIDPLPESHPPENNKPQEEPKAPSQPKKPRPSGGDESPVPMPETPEQKDSPPPKPPEENAPKQDDDESLKPGEKTPPSEAMPPGNAEPKSPPSESVPPGETEPPQPKPSDNQEPAPDENQKPAPEQQAPETEKAEPEEPRHETRKQPVPQPQKPNAKPKKKARPAPSERPKPKQESVPKPQTGPERKESSQEGNPPASPGRKASEGGGDGPDIPFKTETRQHMAPLLHGIRIISGKSLGQLPGKSSVPKAPPTPDRSAADSSAT